MPHSSGGGSHGGGSHSSYHSSHHGGGSGQPSRRLQTRPFNGARVFFTYIDGHQVYRYADYDIVGEGKRAHIRPATAIISFVVVLVFLAFISVGMIQIPRKLSVNTEKDIKVVDEINILTNEEETEIQIRLSELYEKTGIATTVLVEDNSAWQPYYDSLEGYAYDRYCREFEDEYHWLIIYTQPENPDSGFIDWYWEGMIGDDTASALPQERIDAFNEELQENLYRYPETPSKAFIKAFDNLITDSQKILIDREGLLVLLSFLVEYGFFMVIICFIEPMQRKKYADYVEVKNKKPVEIKCDYCGGVYIVGTCTTCPHCAAPVKTETEAEV